MPLPDTLGVSAFILLHSRPVLGCCLSQGELFPSDSFQVYYFSAPRYHLKSAEMTQDCEGALADQTGAGQKGCVFPGSWSRVCRRAAGAWSWLPRDAALPVGEAVGARASADADPMSPLPGHSPALWPRQDQQGNSSPALMLRCSSGPFCLLVLRRFCQVTHVRVKNIGNAGNVPWKPRFSRLL